MSLEQQMLERRARRMRDLYRPGTPVTCEPCKRGGGPADCVRPCVVYSVPRSKTTSGA